MSADLIELWHQRARPTPTDKDFAAYVKSLLWYDPATGVFRWRFSTVNNKRKPWSVAGSKHPKGYVNIKIGALGFRAHRLAWLYVTGEWPAGEIDHINGVRDDNRFCNLRTVDRVENCHNRHSVLSKTARVLGVSWHKASRRWVAQMSANNKKVHIGTFDTIEAAKAAYDAAKSNFLQEYKNER